MAWKSRVCVLTLAESASLVSHKCVFPASRNRNSHFCRTTHVLKAVLKATTLIRPLKAVRSATLVVSLATLRPISALLVENLTTFISELMNVCGVVETNL